MSNKHPKSGGITVKANNIDQALRTLKRQTQRDGVLKTFKQQAYYETPSEKKRRESDKIKRRWNIARRKDIAKNGESRKPQWN